MLTQLLERNAARFPDDVALVEINPGATDKTAHTWREFSLTQSIGDSYRREMTPAPTALPTFCLHEG